MNRTSEGLDGFFVDGAEAVCFIISSHVKAVIRDARVVVYCIGSLSRFGKPVILTLCYQHESHYIISIIQ